VTAPYLPGPLAVSMRVAARRAAASAGHGLRFDAIGGEIAQLRARMAAARDDAHKTRLLRQIWALAQERRSLLETRSGASACG
jgi:hypothetical protein